VLRAGVALADEAGLESLDGFERLRDQGWTSKRESPAVPPGSPAP
jgi:hypothetical protein